MTTQAAVLDLAASFIGYKETPVNDTVFGSWYGLNYNPWCAMFACYCAYEAGIPVPATTGKGYAYAPSGMAYFKRMGMFSASPVVGAHVFFNFPGDGAAPNHVGLVEKVLANSAIQTIEGNTDNVVARRVRNAYIMGYGVLPYHVLAAVASGGANAPVLSQPVVEIMATPSGNGYWLVAEDGGVFSFGDAPFYGSMGGHSLNAPVVGAALHPTGRGYALVGADGGVFNFGVAKFHGSMGGRALQAPMKSITFHPSGDGYWLTAKDGGVFAFGAAQFHGSPYDIKK